MTDEEFEDLNSRRSKEAAAAERTKRDLDERVDAWLSTVSSEEAAYDALKKEREHSRAAGWRVLARIYVIAPQLKVGATLDTLLRNEIEALPEQADRKRQWNPKDGYDVALTYVHGLSREAASTKSNWRATVTQAEKEKVPHDEGAFLAWLQNVGGEEKARRPELRKQMSLTELAQAVPTAADPANAFEVEIPPEQELPNGFAVVFAKVYRRHGDRCLLQPLEVFNDERSVKAAAAKLQRKWEAERKAQERQLQREQERARKRQEQIDEHGHRPPKRQKRNRRKNRVPPLGAQKRKAKGATILPFVKQAESSPSKREGENDA